MIKFRHLATVITLFSIILMPYWVYLPLLLASMILFPLFWEGMVLAFLIDILYGRGIGGLPELISPMAFSAMLILLAVMPLRERLRVT
jgi:hypothetical protein